MKLPDKLAHKISSKLNYDEERSAVISYGIFASLHVLVSIALVALIGLLLDVVFQALTVSFAASILRQYSGGVHATKPIICLIVGTVVTIAVTMLAHYSILLPIGYLIGFVVIIIVSSYYLIIKYAPVDSKSKPLRTERKRKKMKKLSLVVLSFYTVCIFIFGIFHFIKGDARYIDYAMCIGMATGWQAFTLTQKGHRLIRKVDSMITTVFFKKGALS